MPPINRRHFLQFAGSTLASIGLSQLDVFHQGNRYGRVLAQSTSRKLALLVGVNDYPDRIPKLKGCLTDVELQRELLVHRYGFNPKDIMVVSDNETLKPNRATILEAFQTHLINQAKPGDVVVFHFSGHGSLVRDPKPLPELVVNNNGVLKRLPNPDQLNGTIVPFDRTTTNPEQVQDIMGQSLFLLTYRLATDNVTVVLDSCHSGGGTRGNLLFRAVDSRFGGTNPAAPSKEELEFQKRLIQEAGLTEAKVQELRKLGIAKGVAIGSANYDQLAADAPFDGGTFYAGAFTYLLTRYLWQQSVDEAIGTVFVNLARSTRDVSSRAGVTQEPIFAANPASNSQKPVYFLQPPTPFAEAVVKEVNADGQIQYWLGGISSLSLKANQAGTVFTVLDRAGKEIGQIEQTSRNRLMATGKLKSGKLADITTGMLLRERVRGLPANLKLQVGLDPSLGKDLPLVQAELQKLDRIEVVASNQTMNYRVGRMTSTYQTQAQQRGLATLPKVDSLGLFTGDLRPLAATFDQAGESVTDAVARLAPRLKSFLAAEVLKAIGGVDVVGGSQSRGLKVEVKSTGQTGRQVAPNRFIPGTQIEIQITNNSDRDLFVSVISIGDAGRMRVLFPYVEFAEGRERIPKGETLRTPEKGVDFPLGGPGMLEIMVLSSPDSLRDALKALKEIGARGGVSSSRGISPNPLTGEDAIDVMGALLGNIDQRTRSDIIPTTSNPVVDATRYAVISTTIEVVPG
ncbi:MAG: caspase family protein [Leptolyngbyaceae cyanobacterium bins.349]|nr:caspase family protein [Leptolyngbyaceae cyanobacterium bins.349]